MEPFDLILLLSLIFSSGMIALSLWLHEVRVKEDLKEAGCITSGEIKGARSGILQKLNDPNISLLGWSWILALVALLFISSRAIILRTSLISGGVIISISIVFLSFLIIWLFGLRIPVFGKELKYSLAPLRGRYQECFISKRYYNIISLFKASFALAIFSILFAFGGYIILYYHNSFSILGIRILGIYLYSLAAIFFAICMFLLVSPMLSDWWGWAKYTYLIYLTYLKRWIKDKFTLLFLASFIVFGLIFVFVFQSTEIIIGISFSILGMIFSYALSIQFISKDPAFIKSLIDRVENKMQSADFDTAERRYDKILELLSSNDTDYLKKIVIEKKVELYKKTENEKKYKEYIKILEEIEVPQYIREIQSDLKDIKEMIK